MDILNKLQSINTKPIFGKQVWQSPYHVFDFSEQNKDLDTLDLMKQGVFEKYIEDTIKSNNAQWGIGKYAENRVIYRRSILFENEESRCIHLGIDLWAPAGTSVFAPLDGVVHSYANNDNFGDYGPTIILSHNVDGFQFYTLYGHLSIPSLSLLSKGKQISAGEEFCSLGDWSVNLAWPPHLHFQVVMDIGLKLGDFPGVCTVDKKEAFMKNSPDPQALLKIPSLPLA